MKIKKFQGEDMRQVLAQVRKELGPEAMIVTTQTIRRGLLKNGVEVTAALEDNHESLLASPSRSPRLVADAPASGSMSEHEVERILAPLRAEIRSLRVTMRSMCEDRGQAKLSAEIAALRQALGPIARGHEGANLPPLQTIADSSKIAALPRKRITALVGPTGVGKTTTIAKLAAQAALLENKSTAIISLDNYRVGGEEQVRIFADLIGVPLTIVSDPSHFDDVIAGMDDLDCIFVDTAGRSPRDARAIDHLTEALAGNPDIEVHLVLAASTSTASIDGWFERCHPLGVSRLLMTKLDEADDLTELVRAPARLKTPITYVTAGQRVPEDIEVVSKERLLSLASEGLSRDEMAA